MNAKNLSFNNFNSNNIFHLNEEKEINNIRSKTFIIKDKPFVPQIHPMPNDICPSPCFLHENNENEFLHHDFGQFTFHINKVVDDEDGFSSSNSNVLNSDNLNESINDSNDDDYDENKDFNINISIDKNSLGNFRKNFKIQKTKTFNINDDFDFFRKSKNLFVNKYKQNNIKNVNNDNLDLKKQEYRFKSMNFSRNVNTILEYLKNNAIK